MTVFLTEFAESAPLLYFLCSLVLGTVFSLLFIPSLPITAVNVIVYGPIWGGVISFMAEMLAAYVTFHLYRLGWLHAAQKIPRLKNTLSDRIERQAQNGFWQIVLLRLIPFFPSSGVTVYALVRKIGLIPYMWGSAVGKLPAMLIEVLSSLGITWLFADQLDKMLLSLFAVVFLFCLIQKQREKQKRLNQNQPHNHNQSDKTE